MPGNRRSSDRSAAARCVLKLKPEEVGETQRGSGTLRTARPDGSSDGRTSVRRCSSGVPRVVDGRGNGTGEPLGSSCGVGLHAGQDVLVGLHGVRDVAWPSRSLTTFTGMPSLISRLPWGSRPSRPGGTIGRRQHPPTTGSPLRIRKTRSPTWVRRFFVGGRSTPTPAGYRWQHLLALSPEPHGHGELRGTFAETAGRFEPWRDCTAHESSSVGTQPTCSG
jgi:hypothetical protein